MSLARLLAAYDEAALVALSSKGLLIRARKDVEAGSVAMVSEAADGATLDVLGETVTLAAKALDDGRCTCPATGICRHILAAVLVVREGAGGAVSAQPDAPAPPDATPGTEVPDGDQSDEPPEAPAAPIAPESVDFDVAKIEAFAGADWAQACAMAETAQVPEAAGSVVVSFEGSDAQVTFPAGLPLQKALYKGPVAAHRRRAIAAAALAVAQRNGAPLPEVITADAARTADPETLGRAQDALGAAAVALAAGTLAQAQRRLFDLGISARAEAVPRLAAELRGLSARLDAGRLRSAAETPVGILGGIARTHALVAALAAAPGDPVLAGVLARSFVASGPKSLAFLGGETWAAPSGAKGLTLVFADLATGAIHRATHARAAGTDLGFEPRRHWDMPLWSLAKPPDLAGRTVHLPDAALAADGGLSLTQTATFGGDAGFGDLPGVHDDWAKADIAAVSQKGLGLRRLPGEAYIVLAPDEVGAVTFDDYAQAAFWDWRDARGHVFSLRLGAPSGGIMTSALAAEMERKLVALARRIRGGLVAVQPGRRSGRLVSVWLEGQAGPLSLAFSVLPKPGGLSAMIDRFIERARPRAASGFAPIDPLTLYFEKACEGVLSGLIGRPGLPDALVSDARALGLAQVLAADADWRQTGAVDAALRLAYVLQAGLDLVPRRD